MRKTEVFWVTLNARKSEVENFGRLKITWH